MRGRRNPQASMLAFVDLEERVPQISQDPGIADGTHRSTGLRGAQYATPGEGGHRPSRFSRPMLRMWCPILAE